MEIPDNYDMWLKHEREQELRLSRYPKCDDCGDPAADDYYYVIGGRVICASCMDENYRVYNEEEYDG